MNILWIRLRSLGDAILSLPAIGYLRRTVPGARIDLVLHPAYVPLFEGHPWIDRVYSVPRSGRAYLQAIFRRLPFLDRAYDAVINAHGGRLSAWLTRRVHAPMRIGFTRYPHTRLYTHRMALGPEDYHRYHTVQIQARLIEPLVGHTVSARELYFDGFTHLASGAESPGGGGPTLLFHPGGRFRSKRWPDVRTIRFLEHLLDRFPEVTLELMFGPDERNRMRAYASLVRAAGDRVRVRAAPDLIETVRIFRRVTLFVGFDSGLVHLAAAVGCPVMVLWGPGYPALWSPWRTMAMVVRPLEGCGTCTDKTCPVTGNTYCIDRLREPVILDLIARMLRRAAAVRMGAPLDSLSHGSAPPAG